RLTAHLYGQQQGVDALLSLSRKDWDRMMLADDEALEPNKGDYLSGLMKLGWQINTDWRSELSYQRYNEDNFRSTNPQAGNDFPYQQMHHITQEDLVLSLNSSGPSAWDARLYHSQLLRKTDANSASFTPLSATRNETKTLGFSLMHSRELTLGTTRHRISMGTDGYRDRQNARDGGEPNSVIPDGTQSALGLFAQDEIRLGERWLLIPNLRWDRFNVSPDANDQPDNSASRLSGKMALQWQANDSLNLFASYGSAFRAPTLTELYNELNDPQAFANFAPNPNLDSEVAQTFEVGTQFHQHDLVHPGDNLNLRLSLYRENVDDLIETSVIGGYTHPALGQRPIMQYRNIRDARRWGVEVEGHYAINNWALALNYSRMRVEDKDSGANLYSPPDQLHLQVDYQLPQLDSAVRWRSTWVADQDYDSTLLRRRDGYDRHDLFVSWAPSPDWRVDLGVENLFDAAYSSYQSANRFADINEKGRSWKASLSAQF
ncbi:MAG: TonB-dependent receptor domain-containing protein, partial [Marinobacterium sp.]